MMDFLVSYMLMPVFHILMQIAGFFSPKIRQGLQDRQGNPWMKSPAHARPVIIHCSSGEFEYAKPLIRNLKKLHPNLPIYVSYFSPTYKTNILNTPEVDFAFPSPWENPLIIDDFLRHTRPRAYLISRTDAWPVMLARCRKHKIPTVLFSATLSKNAKRLANPLSRRLSRWILSHVDQVLCVTEEDQKQFQTLGVSAQIAGDTRYDQVLWRISNPKPLRSSLRAKDSSKIIVCGSTWPEDEVVLAEAAEALKGSWRWIMAPHEPSQSHLRDLELLLTERGLSVQYYSQNLDWTSDVLIIDQVGILADLYAWGQAAFVGGSFRKTVHSVMEPLAQGCWTLVGPQHTNNREALLFQELRVAGGSPVKVISNGKELVQILKDLQPARESIQALTAKQAGASQSIATCIQI